MTQITAVPTQARVAAERPAAPAVAMLPWPAPRPAGAPPQACRDTADTGRIRVGAAFRIATATS